MIFHNKNNNFSIFYLLILVFISGCTTQHGVFPLLSDKKINLSDISREDIQGATPVYAESKCESLFIFPIQFCSFNDAIDKAMSQRAGADFLVDATIIEDEINLFPLYMTTKWTVYGKAGISK